MLFLNPLKAFPCAQLSPYGMWLINAAAHSQVCFISAKVQTAPTPVIPSVTRGHGTLSFEARMKQRLEPAGTDSVICIIAKLLNDRARKLSLPEFYNI